MKRLLVGVLVILFTACGGKGGSNGDDDAGNGDANVDGDADPNGVDAPPFGGQCTPGGPQCSNCVDDDGDTFIDGQDVECTGPNDNDESSFETGIPGDNVDPVKQDCFFDGNSGAGNDGCNIHVCCLLGAQTKQDCPLGANQYDPADCPPPLGQTPLPQKCIDNCSPLTPPGCDCFGCCTICDPATNDCFDILINPASAPNCDASTISDPVACPRCTKNDLCGNGECGGTTCILCPGQDQNDLPPECNGSAACPMGVPECTQPGSVCPPNTFCQGGNGTAEAPGCCVGGIT